MSVAVRRAVPVAALLVCVLATASAHAQGRPPKEPPLTGKPPVPLGTPTPTPSATPSPTATATPTATPTASPRPTASAAPGRGAHLARTGSDAGLLALAGVSLLGMGLSLRRLVEPHGAV
jgi:hypothetical protein